MNAQPIVSLWRHETLGPRPVRVTMAEIVEAVAERHGLTVADLKGPARASRVSQPRHEAMHEMRERTSQSLPAIGRFLGGRDHATVIHGVRRHQERIDQALEASHG